MIRAKPLISIECLDPVLQKAIQSIPKSDRYYIALSGGIDSVALTYFCLPYLRLLSNNVQAIHIHHGLSSNADAWADFCVEFCSGLGIVCHVEHVNVVMEGTGLEAAARKVRYEVFEHYLQDGGVLLQGHHLNDQAETVLMRVFKGLGPEAIKGIPRSRALSHGLIYRPWLEVSRDQIESAAHLYDLSCVDDESNLDGRFERNYIRHDILPLLAQRRPSILNDLSKTAKKSEDNVDFIKEWCELNQCHFFSQSYTQYQAIDVPKLLSYSELQQKAIIRYWFDFLGISHPSEGSFQRIFKELLRLNSNSQAEVSWGGLALRVYDNALFCLSVDIANPVDAKQIHEFDILLADLEIKGQHKIKLINGSLTLSTTSLIEPAYDHVKAINSSKVFTLSCKVPLSLDVLKIGYRQGGEKMQLGSKHSTTLKKLYQVNKVLPWLRDKLPLIFSEQDLVGSMAGFVAGKYNIDQKNTSAQSLDYKKIYFLFELD